VIGQLVFDCAMKIHFDLGGVIAEESSMFDQDSILGGGGCGKWVGGCWGQGSIGTYRVTVYMSWVARSEAVGSLSILQLQIKVYYN
jgi:hypothetical protein